MRPLKIISFYIRLTQRLPNIELEKSQNIQYVISLMYLKKCIPNHCTCEGCTQYTFFLNTFFCFGKSSLTLVLPLSTREKEAKNFQSLLLIRQGKLETSGLQN